MMLSLAASALAVAPVAGAATLDRTSARSEIDHAYELARFLNSEERADQLWEPLFKTMPAWMMQAPDVAALVKHYPGGAETLVSDIRPALTSRLKAHLPALWDKIASVYRQRLSPDDSARLLAFYSSPANVRLTREILRRIDMNRAIDAKSLQVDGAASKAMAGQAYPLALATLAPGERAQVLAFKASPLAAKYAALTGDIRAARASWMEAIEPQVNAELEREMERIATERASQQ